MGIIIEIEIKDALEKSNIHLLEFFWIQSPQSVFEILNLNKGHGGHLLLPVLNFYSPHTNMKEQIII